MAHARRTFLQSAALAVGAAAASPVIAQAVAGRAAPFSSRAATPGQPAAPPTPASDLQIPRIRFGGVEISRMVVGCNPLYGFSHFNQTLSTFMREYYTPERVCDLLHQCARFGINAYNYVQLGRAPQDLARFQAEGGRMHLIVQGIEDPAQIYAQWKPLAIYHHGGRTDRAVRDGKLADVREWCKKARDTGARVGVGTHNPQVIETVEAQGWDVDFFAGCAYNLTRSDEEWRRVLNGELIEMSSEIYLQSDPARMFTTLRQTPKPCFTFKILAAGRVAESAIDQAFEKAFSSIKPTDGIFVGMFPRTRDEVRENAERVCRILRRQGGTTASA